MSTSQSVVSLERIATTIHIVRGQKVMLDADLASLYAVQLRALIQAVKRNLSRFPTDFMFQLTIEELALLRSQIVISKAGRGGRRYLPYAFTEQGVAMLSSVLRSERAISVNIEIMRAFVRLRQLIDGNAELRQKLDELERKYDRRFRVVFQAIRQLMHPDPPPKHKVGFRAEEPRAVYGC